MHSHDHASHDLPLEAQKEKNRVALVSVFAALVLTGTKVGVGLWTGSLGILAEALHSALDLAAAAITLWAVRAAAKPADEKHSYGHGKIENLSALIETLLLLATSVWIIREAIGRLWGPGEGHVEANLWSFLVVILSIALDYSRSRALLRVAKKYHSQALEADALHFSTDIGSSVVVLLGLGGVYLSKSLGVPWLIHADAVAALGVAMVVVWVCVRMGKKSIDDLLDTVPPELSLQIEAAAKVEGVRDVRHVRVRRSGPELFVDLSLLVNPGESLVRGHTIALCAEAAIQRQFPSADIVVRLEPSRPENEDLLEIAHRIAASHGAAPHNLVAHGDEGAWVLEFHVEMAGDLTLAEANRRSVQIETEIARALPHIAVIRIHIEPKGIWHPATDPTSEEIKRIEAMVRSLPEIVTRDIIPQNIEIRRCGSEFSLSFICPLSPQSSVYEAHEFTEKVEISLRKQIPELGHVMVRVVPTP